MYGEIFFIFCLCCINYNWKFTWSFFVHNQLMDMCTSHGSTSWTLTIFFQWFEITSIHFFLQIETVRIKFLAVSISIYSARNLEMSIRFSLKSRPSERFHRPEMSQIKAEISLFTNVKLIFHKNVGLQWYQWIPNFYNISRGAARTGDTGDISPVDLKGQGIILVVFFKKSGSVFCLLVVFFQKPGSVFKIMVAFFQKSVSDF